MSASDGLTALTADPLRAQAIKRLKAKADFHNYLWVCLAVSLIVNVVWAVSGPPLPYWPMLGMGIGAFFLALGAYGPANRGLTEKRIEAEMRRLADK